VIRLSCELPYAVGVRNTTQSITRLQRKQSKRKQSKRQTTSGVLSSVLPVNSELAKLVLFFSANASVKTLHQSHVDSAGRTRTYKPFRQYTPASRLQCKQNVNGRSSSRASPRHPRPANRLRWARCHIHILLTIQNGRESGLPRAMQLPHWRR